MKTKGTERFLEQNPEMRRWINECVTCHQKGYKPETPESKNRFLLLYKLRHGFAMLELDANGMCEQCGSASGPWQSN